MVNSEIKTVAKKLVITGAGGFVGGWLVRESQNSDTDWETHALTRNPPPERPRDAARDGRGTIWHGVDILDGEELHETLRAIGPQAVIHAAAMADIDACETRPDEAERVNATLTERIAGACCELGARMVYLSTDTVFDGEKGDYSEEDEPRAINTYARTKIRAEEIVRDGLDDAVVARVALVMGLPAFGAGNAFLPRLIAAFKEGREVSAPAREIRTPVDVITLSRGLIELAGNNFKGTIHLAGREALNRLEMNRRIAARLGCSDNLVKDSGTATIAGRAPRPRDVSLKTDLAARILSTPLQDFDAGLNLVLEEVSGENRV